LQKETIRNIESLRKKSGLSQNDLAMKMGWNQKQISRLERGERKDLDYENTELLAKALGVNIKEINPEFSKNNNQQKTVSNLINELSNKLPIEVPVFLQRDCGNSDSQIVYYEYSANTNSKNNSETFPSGQEGDYFAMVCETNYDWPAFSSSDLLISDKNLNPTDPFDNPGTFNHEKWELYDRILIKLDSPIDDFYTHPAIWIGQGKALLKPLSKESITLKYNQFTYLGVVLSRRFYFNRSTAKSYLSANYGIKKKFGIRKWIPNTK